MSDVGVLNTERLGVTGRLDSRFGFAHGVLSGFRKVGCALLLHTVTNFNAVCADKQSVIKSAITADS